MKVSLKWLKDYVNISLPLWELAERLTMAGIEVKSIESIGQRWEQIVVGEVGALAPHPHADRLQLVSVSLGKESLTVVSGAFNLKVGDKVPFAHVGAQLIDGHTGRPIQLKPAKIRGIVSEGMVCSEKELGISQDHTGIMILPSQALVGIPLADFLGDAILDLEITPNRPDCLSVLGIAQEIAALTQQKVHFPQVHYQESGAELHSLADVDIADSDLCARYTASLISDVRVVSSPPWIQERLLAYGMRPINNIVDVTNYVMLEYGQPLHAFDFQKVKGHKIIVRRAKEGDSLTTLDKVTRPLTSDILVIADYQSPVAIGGVMGGAESEVTESTTAVLLESANFHPVSIRRTSQKLRLRSEASLRFEKGLSPELPPIALKRATQLLLEVAGGKAARGIIDVYPHQGEKKPISLSASQVNGLLGTALSQEQIIQVLTSLGFECQEPSKSYIQVTIPYWRTDINLVADLVEEVARITGYDKIPTTMLGSPLPQQQPDPALTLRTRVQEILVGCGLQEVISYSLTSEEKLRLVTPFALSPATSPLRVANPMSREQEYLRTSLRPSLLSILSSNQKHQEGGIRLFEIGKVYLPKEKDLPDEKEMAVGVLSGVRSDHSWRGGDEKLDFFDAKGIVETLLQRLGVEAQFKAGGDVLLHPGRRAKIEVEGREIGVVGELHPGSAESFDLPFQPVALFEIDLDELLPLVPKKGRYKPLPRFPSSTRDLAIVVDSRVPARKVHDTILRFPLVSQTTLFDLYTGGQVPAGKKSLAFRVVYQSPSHTLTDEEVNQTHQEILTKLHQELGASLRS